MKQRIICSVSLCSLCLHGVAFSGVAVLFAFVNELGVFSGVSLACTNTRKMADIPAGDVAKGEKLFNGRCATCHTVEKVSRTHVLNTTTAPVNLKPLQTTQPYLTR